MKGKLLLTSIFIISIIAVVLIRELTSANDLLLNTEVDLGNVNIDSKKEFEVALINPSYNEFELTKAYTSCGCTRLIEQESSAMPLVIKPGKTAQVLFEFDPSSMHVKGDEINHEVYFLITNPIEKEYKVKITGKII
ncbi:hypothetical protein A3F07_03965 [candidate division WWE3 bacterium RIFCSPHIGHO2_12_FULL_38_15]|uniref:DUF1573 domain-containing protein n=1 Tax=candidate division WWE3 bacterium RIFCSPHIGHO2_02_FULL_38_14 TaxID=1802620 RepID=A0A1F4V9D8_UNCKA|nr:MAG: hypothetical protein A2793_00195 [candidate division WWE3 bacterium RIFCSPHIGHO2_01_FULL_38_45]OGC48967.1 MAG: hypothetical protein A3F07_03965 [candidate division WWE3 bacterium RIFCSPHIGHO2_12_FULL_38_15]OGC53273.1 MAG: hypothetical protein A3D91_02560 [candidate division WWE3 bacterium RIFCSPHIGHO2_02_FULL_38_14]OGC53708.1 MAG: hypothetical protein A3B64_04730 [candidate division WWE3 bacterium RIFCSPLOWO2_01_FULL_37_24]